MTSNPTRVTGPTRPTHTAPRHLFPSCPAWCDVPADEHHQAGPDLGAYVHVRAWEVLNGAGALTLASVQGLTPWDRSEAPTLRLDLPGVELDQAHAGQLLDVLAQAVAAWGIPDALPTPTRTTGHAAPSRGERR